MALNSLVIFAAFALILSATEVKGAQLQLSCDSYLRLLQPWRFKHCRSCSYSSWSSWNRIANLVSSNHCPSGYAYLAEQTRIASSRSTECKDTVRRRYQCK